MLSILTPEVLDALVALSGAAVTGIVGWFATIIKQRTGVEVSARAQATLHSALNTGALLAWSRLDERVTPPSREEMIQTVIGHVTGEGAGDSVAHFNLSPTGVRTMAEAALMRVGMQVARDAGARTSTEPLSPRG